MLLAREVLVRVDRLVKAEDAVDDRVNLLHVERTNQIFEPSNQYL